MFSKREGVTPIVSLESPQNETSKFRLSEYLSYRKMRIWMPNLMIKTLVTKFLSFDQFCHFSDQKLIIANIVIWVFKWSFLIRWIQWCKWEFFWRSVESPKGDFFAKNGRNTTKKYFSSTPNSKMIFSGNFTLKIVKKNYRLQKKLFFHQNYQ